MPARIILRQPRRSASPISPSTRSAAWRSKTWSRAPGLSQVAQLPRRDRGRDLLPQASLRFWHAAPGAGSITSRPTSDPRWWRTTWSCSPASNRHRPPAPTGSFDDDRPNQVHPRSPNDSFDPRRYFNAKAASPRRKPPPPPFYAAKKTCVYGRTLV